MDELLNKLREVYKVIGNGHQEAITEAVNELKNQAAELETLRAANPLPEAPASATVKVVHQETQLEWLFTVRGHEALSLADRLPEIAAKLQNTGYIAMDAYIDKRRAERHVERSANGQPKQANQPSTVTPPVPQPINGTQTDSFPAERLVISVNDGNKYFKVQGGRWKQHGITIWPEVLEAADFFAADLDPMQPLDLRGYTAVCELKENGNPKKVIRLIRQQ